MLDFYRGLEPREKALVFVVAIAVIVLIFGTGGDNAGIVAGAQVAAALGTFILAGLAYAQVREMRETRISQERPHVIVDADYKSSFVYLVVRNLGQGAAKDITFEFSAPVEAPEGVDNSLWVPLNEQGYFARGMDFLAPGAELRNFWGTMRTLPRFLEERGLDNGIKITSRHKSLAGRQHESELTVNPILVRDVLSTPEKGIQELAEATEQIANGLYQVIDSWRGELVVSTESERRQRDNRESGEEGS